jgi:hypothetical protein
VKRPVLVAADRLVVSVRAATFGVDPDVGPPFPAVPRRAAGIRPVRLRPAQEVKP